MRHEKTQRRIDPAEPGQASVAAPVGLAQRVLRLFWLKGIGSTLVISVFFVGYFAVLNHPLREAQVMPLLALDQWIPVVPWSAWLYFSLWIYICLPSSLMRRAGELAYYLMGATLLSGIGLSLFYFLPTSVPVWEIDWNQHPALAFLKSSDAAGNACPSLHVAFAVYAGFWMSRMLHLLGAGRVWLTLNWLWCGLIILSTLTTKQHVVLDVLCGAVLGALVFWLNEWIARKAKFAKLT